MCQLCHLQAVPVCIVILQQHRFLLKQDQNACSSQTDASEEVFGLPNP